MIALVIIANLIIITILLWRLHAFLSPQVGVKVWVPALFFKIICGVVLGLLYSLSYESGDTWSFFQESSKLCHLAKTDFVSYFEYVVLDKPGFESIFKRNPGASFLTKLTSIFSLITGNSYWLISLYFSFFSFYGLSRLVRALQRIAPGHQIATYIAFFFWPSFIFWSSGLSKEALALGAIGVLSAFFLELYYLDKRLDWKQILINLFMLGLLWKVKYYYGAVLILVLISLWMTGWVGRQLKINAFFLQAGLFFVSGFFATLVVSTIHPNFEFTRLREVIVLTHDLIVERSHPGGIIRYHQLSPEPGSLIMNSPLALVSGIFRPLVWDDVSGNLKLLASVENMILLLLTVSAPFLIRFNCKVKTHLMILACISYCVILSVLLALSTPNFGTLVRYRVGFQCFFVLLVLFGNKYILDRIGKVLGKFA